MYTIKIEYRTGNSFGSSEETEYIGCAWNDINKAKLALSYIKQHNEYFNKINDYHKPTKKEEEAAKNQPWYYSDSKYKDSFYSEHRLYVEKDDGTKQLISAFWRGYFEQLLSAEIVQEEDDSLKYIP